MFCLAECSRDFPHRIKSISMAKFTPGEVANLQSGGNGVQLFVIELCEIKQRALVHSIVVDGKRFLSHRLVGCCMSVLKIS